MSNNVFEDLGFSKEEAAVLENKSFLFSTLQAVIKESGMTQTAVADLLGTDQAKISKILSGKITGFSIERISEYLERFGYHVTVSIEPKAPVGAGR